MPKVHLFPIIPALEATTQLYTQRVNSTAAPENFRFTIAMVVDFLQNTYGIKAIEGQYASDAEAQTGGVAIGNLYELTADNIYGLPEGLIKTRRE